MRTTIGRYHVTLGDNGTLDTLLYVQWRSKNGWEQEEVIFCSDEYSAFRDENGFLTDWGFEEMAQEAVESVEIYVVD